MVGGSGGGTGLERMVVMGRAGRVGRWMWDRMGMGQMRCLGDGRWQREASADGSGWF